MAIIVHITHHTQWQTARDSGAYTADTLPSEGFIHCSTPTQVVPTANYLFRGQTGLVLLLIDTAKVPAPLKYENLAGGAERFPHIYGPIPTAAVVAVLDFPPQADGTFLLPDSFAATLPAGD